MTPNTGQIFERWLLGYVVAIAIVGCVTVAHDVWDLKAADWAAWAQAVGTVLAVIAAVVVANRQSNEQRKREAARELSGDLRAYHLLQSIVLRLKSCLDVAARKLSDPRAGDTLADRVARRDELAQVTTALDELPVHVLPEFDAVAGLIDARLLAARALDRATTAAFDVELRGGSAARGAGWQDLANEASRIADELHTAVVWMKAGVSRSATVTE